MIPTQHLPKTTGMWSWEIFTPTTVSLTDMYTWTKPSGITWVFILGCGGAGGGGAGASGADGTPRGGGGGGSAGTSGAILVPAMMCPSQLFINVGPGGRGATPGESFGQSGSSSYITPRPDFLGTNGAIAVVGGGGRGNSGTSSAAGTGGTGTGSLNVTSWGGFGAFFTGVGNGGAGSTGGAHTGAIGGSQFPSGVFSNGAGGGGTTSGNFNGGSVSLQQNRGLQYPLISGGTAASPDGLNGFNYGRVFTPTDFIRFDMYSTILGSAGSGGAAISAGNGGNGGNGGLGSGGGGGGAGIVGGSGGAGGDGFVLIGVI